MAQPIFDNESPLDDYLRDTELDLMPGILPEFLQVEDSTYEPLKWLPSFVPTLCHSLESLLSPAPTQASARQFAERFKYIIISSSLLSAYLSPSTPATISIPRLETPDGSDDPHVRLTTSGLLLFLVAPILLASGHWILALTALAAAKLWYEPSTSFGGDKPPQTRSTLSVVHHLVEANTAWESAVGEAMALLRRDESSALGPSIQWQTPLRVALQSSLQAITTQADRVRQLFSPLTSPTELAQMTEMYAPPSPTNSHLSLVSTTELRKSASSSKLDKRTTWSGATAKQLARRSADVHSLSPRPRSPVPPVPRLPSPDGSMDDSMQSFGALALDLQRQKATPKRFTFASPRSATSLRPSPTAASRFTTLQGIRNPLSLNSLDSTLQTALASKRFACSHLLALRFEEPEDDLYWEDVRSVVSLLSMSIEDETARLSEAMDEWHKSRQRDARPSLTSTPVVPTTPNLPPRRKRETLSFAPQPSPSAKVTTHLESISSALDRAFDELESCASALKLRESSCSSEDETAVTGLDNSAQAAITSYESLRRELGIALRECERARGPMMSLVTDGSADSTSDREAEMPSLPDQAPETSRDDSFALDSPTRAGASSPPPAYASRGPSQIVDDATAHLLAGATAMHLPPPGVDRVFEADSGPAVKPYRKERSTLSRQERIALAQAKRKIVHQHQQRLSGAFDVGSGGLFTGEVVQELKAVISRVNEKKQQMTLLTTPNPEDEAVSRADADVQSESVLSS